MSGKKIKVPHAPKHDASLMEAELESRSNLAVSKTIRNKKKVIEDPSLGPELTKKILQNAMEQLEEDKVHAKFDIPSLPAAEEEEEDFDESDGSIVLENNDEESRALFEMFKPSIASLSANLTKKLARTEHIVNPQIREVYVQLGQLLRVYQSGKLPKAVNVIASQRVEGWVDLLDLTEPENWTPNAVKAVTTLFAHSGSDTKCKKYNENVLLDVIRNILEKSKKLPRAIWDALVASARRPKPFIMGLLLPLSQESQCTLKEARIISAIVTRVRLPPDHVNAFIIHLCEKGEVSPVKTIFIARFVSKGQALAIRTIDAILSYFMAFMSEQETQPVIWHKALLDFVKKYGKELTVEQREALEQLMQHQTHPAIDKEIRAKLAEVPPREEGTGKQDEYVPTL